MAKISARGATEVTRLKVRSTTRPEDLYLYVITSDGRCLVRALGPYGSGYRLLGKVSNKASHTQDFLVKLAAKHGRTPV